MSEENQQPPQEQSQPGIQAKMDPQPVVVPAHYRGSGKLDGKAALITGGDSGIGRSVAVLFAMEGADVAIVYLSQEQEDAEETKRLVEEQGRRCVLMTGDVGDEAFCKQAVEQTVSELGKLDVLVNNAAEQHEQKEGLVDISAEQLERTFRTNIFGQFFCTKAALAHLPEGGTIVNSTSVTAYQGKSVLIDYASTKGAIVSFTRSMSESLVEKGIRVNGVAPGPIWTPLIPATFDADSVASFGGDTPMGRAGQPGEVATCFVFLASPDSSYISGQVLHPNGGQAVGG